MNFINSIQLKLTFLFYRISLNLFPRKSKLRQLLNQKKLKLKTILSSISGSSLDNSNNRALKKLYTITERLENNIKTLTSISLAIQTSLAIDQRLKDVTSCPDLSKINKVSNAGQIIGLNQIMHNGLIVALGSYYGEEFHQKILHYANGVHEPQEEYVFTEVLKYIQPNSCMLELGAFWGFYSMWFQKEIANSRTILVEPEIVNLQMGRLNFLLNQFNGEFIQGFLGEKPGEMNLLTVPILTVDQIFKTQNINHLHMLHSDIQGSEFTMLQGAQNAFQNRLIDYCFISTHSDQIHNNCLKFFKDHNYFIISEYNVSESYSADGLIAARRRELNGPNNIKISKKYN